MDQAAPTRLLVHLGPDSLFSGPAIQQCIMHMHPTLTTTVYIVIAVIFVSVVTYMILYTRGLKSKAAVISKTGRLPRTREEGIAVATEDKENSGRTGTIT